MLFSFASVWFYLTLFINDFFVRLKIVKNVDRTRGVHQSFSQRAIVYDLPILQQALLDENHIKYLNSAAVFLIVPLSACFEKRLLKNTGPKSIAETAFRVKGNIVLV